MEEDIYNYRMPRKGADARAILSYPRMIVLKGSIVAEEVAKSMPEPYQALRRKLIGSGIIAYVNSQLAFTCDYGFDNPSVAACVIAGGSRDGYRSWRDAAGKTLSDIGFCR